ncbi:MAG: NAD-dependent epimerase/dehydratase family protein [Betaproteobacteria bacterium]|nr:NAD-dependent epimerase/dehydratase family protein [Betaproteobacteria bacterium]
MRRLLIVGCGDVALRAAPLLARRYRLYGLVHRPEQRALLRARGITPIAGDLDRCAHLRRLRGVAHEILHLAPPPPKGDHDTRTAHLLAALGGGGSLPRRLLYISTSGVYGDCRGALVPETRRVRPETARARRRVDAERRLRAFQRRTGVSVSILRVPGIYAAERLPLARIEAGTPALVAEEDSFSNHVHADDLAQICATALRRGRPGRVYHAVDESALRMGDYFDAVADAFGLRRPPRVTWAVAQARLAPELLSFMRESRRLSNTRLTKELRVRLRYPTVRSALAEFARKRRDAPVA